MTARITSWFRCDAEALAATAHALAAFSGVPFLYDLRAYEEQPQEAPDQACAEPVTNESPRS